MQNQPKTRLTGGKVMMTNTNGMALEAPTLATMLRAMKKIEREMYKAPTEYKVHPDDWDELRTQLKPFAVAAVKSVDSFGLRIVIDKAADRLPRKGRAD